MMGHGWILAKAAANFPRVDLTGFMIIPLAALLTAGWLIGAAIFSNRGPGFRGPFILSFVVGVIFMAPWRIAAWQDLGMFGVMLILLGLWVTAGCLLGGLPALLIISIATKLRSRL